MIFSISNSHRTLNTRLKLWNFKSNVHYFYLWLYGICSHKFKRRRRTKNSNSWPYCELRKRSSNELTTTTKIYLRPSNLNWIITHHYHYKFVPSTVPWIILSNHTSRTRHDHYNGLHQLVFHIILNLHHTKLFFHYYLFHEISFSSCSLPFVFHSTPIIWFFECFEFFCISTIWKLTNKIYSFGVNEHLMRHIGRIKIWKTDSVFSARNSH